MLKNFKFVKEIAFLLSGSILISSCASTTMINSYPSGAKVYLNGEAVGTTPYPLTDTRIVGSTNVVKLEKEGFETYNAQFSRDERADVGAIIGGLFVLVPFLWTMKYKPTHDYELFPTQTSFQLNSEINLNSNDAQKTNKSKVEKLRDLKQLLDDKVITQEEFEKEKKKVLNES